MQDYEDLKLQFQRKTNEFQNLAEEFQQFKLDSEEYTKALELELEIKEKEITSVKQKLDNIQKKNEEIKKENLELSNFCDQSQKCLDEITSKYSETKSKLISLEQENEEYMNQIRNLDFFNKDLKDRMLMIEEKYIIEQEILLEKLQQSCEEFQRVKDLLAESQQEIMVLKRGSEQTSSNGLKLNLNEIPKNTFSELSERVEKGLESLRASKTERQSLLMSEISDTDSGSQVIEPKTQLMIKSFYEKMNKISEYVDNFNFNKDDSFENDSNKNLEENISVQSEISSFEDQNEEKSTAKVIFADSSIQTDDIEDIIANYKLMENEIHELRVKIDKDSNLLLTKDQTILHLTEYCNKLNQINDEIIARQNKVAQSVIIQKNKEEPRKISGDATPQFTANGKKRTSNFSKLLDLFSH